MREPGQPSSEEQRYQTLLENLAEGLVICEGVFDDGGRLNDYWVRAANPMFQRRAPGGATWVGRRLREIRPDAGEAWFQACGRALDGDPVRFEFYDTAAARWFEVHMTRLSGREFAQFFIDVTDRKDAEQRQAALLEELNHRVKNNLTVLSAILELQARTSGPDVQAQLHKAIDRIRAIADLHTSLHQQKSAGAVDLCPYLEALQERLSAALFADTRVTFSTHCEQLTVSIRDAVSLGLIANELVTNAAKYAFDGRAAGEVRLSVTASDGSLRLRVEDDGPGLRPDVASRGIGLEVVRSLARTLHGEVRILSQPGARIEVVAPFTPPGR